MRHVSVLGVTPNFVIKCMSVVVKVCSKNSNPFKSSVNAIKQDFHFTWGGRNVTPMMEMVYCSRNYNPDVEVLNEMQPRLREQTCFSYLSLHTTVFNTSDTFLYCCEFDPCVSFSSCSSWSFSDCFSPSALQPFCQKAHWSTINIWNQSVKHILSSCMCLTLIKQ